MSFVFAYIASSMGLSHNEWPLRLIYLTEAAFLIVAFVCALLAWRLRRSGTQPWRDAVAFVGGVSVSFGLIMPFELAPFFFGAPGEIMLATILLIPFYPIAAVLFTLGFSKFMKGDRPSDLRIDLLSAGNCYDRGVAYLNKKDYDHAIADFTEAIRHNPNFAAAYFNRAVAYFGRQDIDPAIADYDEVISLNPKLAAAYRNRGGAYRAKGELGRAKADFDQAQALMQDEELRLHPEREVSGSGVVRAFSQWMNNRG